MHYMFVNQYLALSAVVFGLSAMCAYVQSLKYLLQIYFMLSYSTEICGELENHSSSV